MNGVFINLFVHAYILNLQVTWTIIYFGGKKSKELIFLQEQLIFSQYEIAYWAFSPEFIRVVAMALAESNTILCLLFPSPHSQAFHHED